MPPYEEEWVKSLLKKLEDLVDGQGEKLSAEDIEHIKDILEYREEITEHFKKRRATRLVIKEYRSLIVAFSAIVSFVLVAWEQLGKLIK